MIDDYANYIKDNLVMADPDDYDDKRVQKIFDTKDRYLINLMKTTFDRCE